MPEVRILTCEPLRPGKSSELLLKFCNPTQHQTQVTLLPLDTPVIPTVAVASEKEEFKEEDAQQVNINVTITETIIFDAIIIAGI